jgi:hypothetical protein
MQQTATDMQQTCNRHATGMKHRSLTLFSLNIQNMKEISGANLCRLDSDLGLYTALTINIFNYDMS